MRKTAITKIKRRTFINIAKAFEELTDALRRWTGSIETNLGSSKDIEVLHEKISECVYATGGEFSARQSAVALGNLYLELSDLGKIRFIHELVKNFDINKSQLLESIKLYTEQQENEYQLRQNLERSLEMPMLKVLHRFVSMPDGLKFIINMRADLLNIPHNKALTKPAENALKSLLSLWFDADLLTLTRITWDSSASLLEKLIKYEAVHRISSWDDLKNRLDSDRRCFAFFHYKMPDEPLIFVEVALVNEISSDIQDILDENLPAYNPDNAKVAIFYSISNTQVGLSGINLGNFLIKRVVEKISSEFPEVTTYATLSPIPGFMSWLKKTDRIKNKDELIEICLDHDKLKSMASDKGFERQMMRACAMYMTESDGVRVPDPVQHFHLSNGAYVRRINWMADCSQNGLSQSAGTMVNYHYDISRINEYCEHYSKHGEPTISREVKQLLKIKVPLQNV